MSIPRVTYIGLYPPTIARNAIALKGLRLQGFTVAECVIGEKGWKKYGQAIKSILAYRKKTDVWLVGYLSPVLVPFVWMFGGKPVVYNATNSFYESVVLDRARVRTSSFSALRIKFLDRLSFACSQKVILESQAQKRFLDRFFSLPKDKTCVVYTGADKEVLETDVLQEKNETVFRVGFRGAFLPATGVECIIDAAALLKDQPIDFYVYGRGMLLEEMKRRAESLGLTRLFFDDRFLDQATLNRALAACDVLLGQFSAHPRLTRTIQNKTFEAFALGKPYITLRTSSNEELLAHEESCLFIDTPDPEQLANSIKRVQEDSDVRKKIAQGAKRVYDARTSPEVIGRAYAEVLRLVLGFEQ